MDVNATDASPSQPNNSPASARVGIGVMLCTLALSLGVGLLGYAWKGTPQALTGDPIPNEASEVTEAQMVEMVEHLAQRLREQPDDLQGWAMLGRSYLVLGQPQAAQEALRQWVARAPKDPSALADLADAIAMGQDRSLAGEPARLLQQALQLDPRHLKALALAGTEAFARQDYRRAIEHWEKITQIEPPDSPLHQQAQDSVAEARQRASVAAAAASGGSSSSAAAVPPAVSGRIELVGALQAQAKPDDVVFVFARGAQGPGMPLAVMRSRVRDLPLSFTLDDSMAMPGGPRLSTAREVVVGARISKSGQATPSPGDFEGFSAPVAVGSRNVNVIISAVRP